MKAYFKRSVAKSSKQTPGVYGFSIIIFDRLPDAKNVCNQQMQLLKGVLHDSEKK
jgi:hypothetical protein